MKKSELRKIIRESIRESIRETAKNHNFRSIQSIPSKSKNILEEGPFSGREVWAELCYHPLMPSFDTTINGVDMWGGIMNDGTTQAFGNLYDFHFDKMTINGNTPQVGDTFKNAPSISGNPQSGGNAGIYKVTMTDSWSVGTTTNFPSAQCQNNGPSYPPQFACTINITSQQYAHNGTFRTCNMVPNEAIFEDWVTSGFFNPFSGQLGTIPGYDYTNPSTWTYPQYLSTNSNSANVIGNSPPLMDWLQFFDSLSECQAYCGGDFHADNNLHGGYGSTYGCMDTLWGVPMTNPGCVQSFPWEPNAYPYQHIQACNANCEYSGAYPYGIMSKDRYMCNEGNCAPCDMTLITNSTSTSSQSYAGTIGGWYNVTPQNPNYGPCKFINEQACIDAQGTPEGCSYPEIPQYRCGHCDTPCTQQIMDLNPGLCVFNSTSDCTNYCTNTDFMEDTYYKCPPTDKFGNMSTNCVPCSLYELFLTINAGQPNSPNYVAGAGNPGCTPLPECQTKISSGACSKKLAPTKDAALNLTPARLTTTDPLQKPTDISKDKIGNLDIKPETEPEMEPKMEPEMEPELILGCTYNEDCNEGQRCEDGVCVDNIANIKPLDMVDPQIQRMKELMEYKKPK